MTPLAFALTLSFAAQGPVEITLGDFRGVGLADEETEMFRARLAEELERSGISAIPRSRFSASAALTTIQPSSPRW